MEARYIAIYKLLGVTKLPSDAKTLDLGALPNPNVNGNVKLTINPDAYCVDIDRSAALGLQFFKGPLGPEQNGTPQERLAAQVERARRDRVDRYGTGVFLVFEGASDIPSPDFKIRRDMDDFAICFDAFPKKEFRAKFTPAVSGVLIAMALGIDENADRRVQKVADVCYLVEPDTGKRIYSFTLEGGTPTISISVLLSNEAIEHVRRQAPTLAADDTLAKIASLLMESLETRTSDLRSFVAAWAALEIFVNATFRAVYNRQWLEILATNAPQSAKSYFDRLKDVMSDKYRLADKFLVIAAILDPMEAANDTEKFKELRLARDSFFHAQKLDVSRLPVEGTQKLLQKYMKLHIEKQTQHSTG